MRVTSIQEACDYCGHDLQAIEAAVAMLPAAIQKHSRAVILRPIVAQAINDGRIPDPTDGKIKYEAIFDLTADNGPAGLGLAFGNTYIWLTGTVCGARLQFYKRDDLVYFNTHPAFMELHRDALTYKPE